MRKLIIDTDPGIDDAFAIIAASKHKDFEILGLTTVAGNKGIDLTTSNALKMIEFCGLNCKVYKGAEDSLQDMNFESMDDGGAHGSDGLGGVHFEMDESALSDQHAVDYILETVNKYPNEVELLVIGPVTNIALAIQKDPETMKKVKAIYSMGGGVATGNMSPVAEFNYWFDATATKIMFDFGKYIPIHMVGLNVTQPSYFTANDIWFMKLAGGTLGEILFDLQMSVLPTSGWDDEKIIGNVIHDLLTFMYMTKPEILTMLHTNVQVETEGFAVGQTVVDTIRIREYGLENAYVAMEVNERLYKESFMDLVFGETIGQLYKDHVKN